MLRLFPLTAQINKSHLTIGGCDTVSLAEEFGTPLYIFDEATLRGKCSEYRKAFEKRYPNSTISYAAKAFLNRPLARLLIEEGMGIDVASGGELSIARAARFPMSKVYFNGDNKSRQELEMALRWSVGRIIVDNFYELSLLNDIAAEMEKRPRILLRLSPGVDAHTHSHLTTGVLDSKFGFTMPQAEEALTKALSLPNLDLVGLHMHLGSQIFEFECYKQAIDIVFDFAGKMSRKHGFKFKNFSAGGGLGVAYLQTVQAKSITEFADVITGQVLKKTRSLGIKPPRLAVEPGRSIVAQAGVALYTIGSMKDIKGIRKYVRVDGGMADNIRPALYDAKYEAAVANKMGKAADKGLEKVTIAGKSCESGDILIKDIELPRLEAGDILALPCCGAYCIPMSSNYLSLPRPAIVMVGDGKAHLIRRRETCKDLMRLDVTSV
jgi:diaminopimelate decarboxylase